MNIRIATLCLATWIAISCDDTQSSNSLQAAQYQQGNPLDDSPVECAPDNGGLTLPNGFCATVFADHLGAARQIAVTDHGDVYVAVQDALDGSAIGGIVALRDSDHGGSADEIQRFGDKGGNGIAYREGQLYFAQNDRVLRYALSEDSLIPTAEPQIVVSGLPADGDHVTKTVVVRDRDLYVNVGSATNACQRANEALESPGIDPCPELESRAGVWRFDADKSDQHPSDGAHFAKGTRSLVALAVNPADGELYGVQAGREHLFENWPDLYTVKDDELLPAEALFVLRPNRHYGWPYCYYDGRMSHNVLAPEYGGDRKLIGPCVEAEEPLAIYPAHWAPVSMIFYQGTAYPYNYREGAFIAFHGSSFARNAKGSPPGYNVVFQPFAQGEASGDYLAFATGFAGDARPLPNAAKHRPVGLAQAPEGSLYVSDDKAGRIWQIFYRGN
jgi:glucose/arabinose dehydrogenase